MRRDELFLLMLESCSGLFFISFIVGTLGSTFSIVAKLSGNRPKYPVFGQGFESQNADKTQVDRPSYACDFGVGITLQKLFS